MNIGIRAHDIDSQNVEELAKIIEKKGFSSIQLALAKSFPSINTNVGSLSPGLAHYISQTFLQHHIQIAVLGCYINIIHPDEKERKDSLLRFKEHLRFARDFGCSIVGTETGNVYADIQYTEKNFTVEVFQKVVASVQELVIEAENFGVIVGIEGGVYHPIHSPRAMRRLLDAIPSQNLQVIYDPVNYLTVSNYKNQEEVIDEAFDLFGDRMVILHAKDFVIENDSIKGVPVGNGLLNYEYIFSRLNEKKPYINILLEETKEPFIEDAKKHLQQFRKM